MNLPKISLTVKLFATFRKDRFEIAEKQYPTDTTVGAIADSLQIPRAEIGILFMNGKHVELETQPQEGDVVSIFPLVGGG